MKPDIETVTFGRDGYHIAVVAGIHGDEQSAMYAAKLLIDKLQDQKIEGRITVLPFANPTAYRKRTRKTPADDKDLNRYFHKRNEAGETEALANEIWRLTSGADLVIDLHTWGDHASLYVLSDFLADPEQKEILKALGIRSVVQSIGVPGQLAHETRLDGRKAILVELPGGQPRGIIDVESAKEVSDAILRLFSHCGMIHGNKKACTEVFFHEPQQRIRSLRDGLFLRKAVSGMQYKEGDIIGILDDEEITMPYDGTLLSVSPNRFLFKEEYLYAAARFLPPLR